MSNPKNKNPWAGLSSYPDPQTGGDRLLFCGRENESYDVARLIDNNVFVTLYGRSGTGKTSLLNAGVFPRLRQEGYLPVSVRLSMDAFSVSFQQGIIQKISQALSDSGQTKTIEVVPLPEDDQALEYLWAYFARTRFVDAAGQVVFPVIVLDQFEEVFRTRREDAEALLRQIHFIMDESHALDNRVIDGQDYSYDFNFRFVIAIREDDLYRLEDSIDNNYLVEMKRCRFRLRNLSEEGARDVVLVPGGDAFAPEAKDQIADLLVGMAKSREDQTVSSVVLSLVCSRIYDDFIRTGARHIDVPLVEQFIKRNPFEQFYNEATGDLTRKERAYIEKNLVDSTGHRNSIPESDFLRIVKNGAPLFEGSKKILQRVSTSSGGGGYRVELIHDSFCEPLSVLKEKRELRERSIWLFAALGFSLLAFFVGLYFARLNKTVTEQKQSLEQTMQQLRSDSLLLAQHVKRIQVDSLEMSLINEALSQERDNLDEANRNLGVANRNLRLRNKELEEERFARRATTEENLALKKRLQQLDSLKTLQSEGAKERNEALSNANVESQDVQEISDGIYEINGLRFIMEKPTTAVLKDWIATSREACAELIEGKMDSYSVPDSMIEDDPCLVYLLLNSKSIDGDGDKQQWFDLYRLMNDDQILKLYDILYREKYKLGQIEIRYRNKQAEIQQKYSEILSEYQKYRSLAKVNPEVYYDTFLELQDKLLDGYAGSAKSGDNTYEVLLSEALEDCEARYGKDPSCRPRFASLKNRMGELRLNQNRVQEAMVYFKSAYQLDPAASAPYLALGYNQTAYEYAKAEDFDLAFETIEKAIQLQPADARYYDSKGEFLMMTGDKTGALEMWRKALELDPDFPSKYKNGTALSRRLKEEGLI